MGTPKCLFLKGPDEVASKWLKTPGSMDAHIHRATARELLGVAEALMVAPRLRFKVYGENVVLAQLVNFLGEKAVRSLIEDGSIEFILWRPLILYMKKGEAPPGLHPLQHGNTSDPAHADPLESAVLGLNWTNGLGAKVRAGLARVAADATQVPDETLPAAAFGLIDRAYTAGELKWLGLEGTVPLPEIDDAQRETLAKAAEDALEVAVLLSAGADLYEAPQTWTAATRLFARVPVGPEGVVTVVENLCSIEGVPSMAQLLARGALQAPALVEIRRRPETEAFRRWLWSQPEPANAHEVSKAYLATLAPSVDVSDRSWFKTARIAGIGVAGGILGTLAAGPLVGIAGAAVSTSVGIGVSLLDGLLLDRVVKRSPPRRFFTDVLGTAAATARGSVIRDRSRT